MSKNKIESKPIAEYAGHTFDGILIDTTGRIYQPGEMYRTTIKGRPATVIMDDYDYKKAVHNNVVCVTIPDIHGKQTRVNVGKAVLKTFKGGTDWAVGYLDGNPLNTNLDNLKWLSRKEQFQQLHPERKCKERKRNQCILRFEDGKLVGRYRWMIDVERLTGISKEDVLKCLNGELESVNGSTFKFEDAE